MVTSTSRIGFASSAPLAPLDELRQSVFLAVPPLKVADGDQTLCDYLAPIHQWAADPAVFPMANFSLSIFR